MSEGELVVADEDDAAVCAGKGRHVVEFTGNPEPIAHFGSPLGDDLVGEAGRQIKELGLVWYQRTIRIDHSF